MRLVHVTTVPESLIFLNGQVRFMRERGFHVEAVSSPGAALEAFGAAEGVPVHEVEMPRRITPLRDLWALFRLSLLLRRIRPGVVHSHTPKGGLLGMIAAFLARVPVRVYHMRGLPLQTAAGFRRRVLRTSEVVSCHLAHRVIAVSHSLRAAALAEGLCSPEKVTVLLGGSGNGVDSEGRFNPNLLEPGAGRAMRRRLGIPEGAQVIGFVGRIVRDKGVRELVAAWRELRESYSDLHLVMVGDTEPRDPIPESVAEELRTDPRAHITGVVPDVTALYAAMDLLVLPSYREGFPNVVLEAAAMGLPVVASAVAGCVDGVQEGVTGALVPPRDTASLAAAIRCYLDHPELRLSHGAAGRARTLRDFRREDLWEALHLEYKRLLSERGVSNRQDD